MERSDAPLLKRALLEHLRTRSYIKLAASRISGVGVVALRDIPADTDPFEGPNRELRAPEHSLTVRHSELDMLPPAVREHALTFFAAMDDPNEESSVPWRDASGGLIFGFNVTGTESMDASWFINHGENPNLRVETAESERGGFNRYVTSRDVGTGEELLANYAEVSADLYERTVGRAEEGSRRASLLAALSMAESDVVKAEASVNQLRAEIEALGRLGRS